MVTNQTHFLQLFTQMLAQLALIERSCEEANQCARSAMKRVQFCCRAPTAGEDAPVLWELLTGLISSHLVGATWHDRMSMCMERSAKLKGLLDAT